MLQTNQCLETAFSGLLTWSTTKTTGIYILRRLRIAVRTSRLLALVSMPYLRRLATAQPLVHKYPVCSLDSSLSTVYTTRVCSTKVQYCRHGPANAHDNDEATKTFDATATRAPTKVGTSKAAGVTDIGPGPAESKVSVTGGLSTVKPSVCTTCGRQTGTTTAEATTTPTPTKNAAAGAANVYVGAFAALGVVYMAAMAL